MKLIFALTGSIKGKACGGVRGRAEEREARFFGARALKLTERSLGFYTIDLT